MIAFRPGAERVGCVESWKTPALGPGFGIYGTISLSAESFGEGFTLFTTNFDVIISLLFSTNSVVIAVMGGEVPLV
jgi:hypothetical protein